MIRSLILSFSLMGILILPSLAQSETTSSGAYSNSSPRYGPTRAALLERKIMCAMREAGIKEGPTNQWSRAQYIARHLSDVIPRLVPPWSDTAVTHLLAQSLSETGLLAALTEQQSEYASSQSEFKGRGIIQLTHRDNYTLFAGCERAINNAGATGQIQREQLAGAPAISSSDIVRNPTSAFSESSEQGQRRNALTAICWMVRTQERHDAFAQALECRSDHCINEVGVAINKGPGTLGTNSLPLNAPERRNLFREIESCFN